MHVLTCLYDIQSTKLLIIKKKRINNMNAMSANDVKKKARQKGTWKKAHKKQSKLSWKEKGS